jgi:hypothetical protein
MMDAFGSVDVSSRKMWLHVSGMAAGTATPTWGGAARPTAWSVDASATARPVCRRADRRPHARGGLRNGIARGALCGPRNVGVGVEVFATDPQEATEEAMNEFGVTLMPFFERPQAGAIMAAMAHTENSARWIGGLQGEVANDGVFIEAIAALEAATSRSAKPHTQQP